MTLAGKIIIIWYAAINFVLYFAMGIDKMKAKKNMRRIPEKTLFTMGLLGGAICGLISMGVYRHKTRKPKFYIVYFIGAALHIGILYLLVKHNVFYAV